MLGEKATLRIGGEKRAIEVFRNIVVTVQIAVVEHHEQNPPRSIVADARDGFRLDRLIDGNLLGMRAPGHLSVTHEPKKRPSRRGGSRRRRRLTRNSTTGFDHKVRRK